MPGPRGFPIDTVTPELSECSRMPASRRPVRNATTACPASWTIVETCRLTDQARGTTTRAPDVAALRTTSQGSAVTGWAGCRSRGVEGELVLAAVEVDPDGVAVMDLPGQDGAGEPVPDLGLDQAPQRPSAVRRVV